MSSANSLTPHLFLDCVVWFPEPNPIHNPTAHQVMNISVTSIS
jgi:hypothetical protein